MQGSNVSAGAEYQGVAEIGARVASLAAAEPHRLSPPLPPLPSGKGGESPAISNAETISAEAGDDGQLRPCQLGWREPQPSENTRRRQTSERGNDLEELCEVARFWPELAPAVRNAILVIVRAHAGEGDRGAAAARAASGASAPVTLSLNGNKIPERGGEFR